MGLIDRKTETSPSESNGTVRLDAGDVERAYQAYREPLLRFLRNVLRNEDQALDALHSTYVKLMETGGSVATDKIKSWLFRVGFNSALNVRRRLKVEQRSVESLAVWRSHSGRSAAAEGLSPEQRELAERAAEACHKLTPEQRQVIHLRLHENLKFREIAEQLKIPLGTVLTRMRTGLIMLRQELKRSSVLPGSPTKTAERSHGNTE